MPEEMDIVDILYEYKMKNDFLKKESFLIGLMIFFWSIFMFYLNDWNNVIIFSTVTFALAILSLKVYDIFSQRAKKFNSLIENIIKEDEIKSDNEQGNFMFTFSSIMSDSPKHKGTKTEDMFLNTDSDEIESEEPKKDMEYSQIKKSFDKLAKRTAERKSKMKTFNYKFRQANSYYYFIEFLDESFYKNSISKNNYFTIFQFYTDFLRKNDPKSLQNVLDKTKLDTLILLEQKESEETNKETNKL